MVKILWRFCSSRCEKSSKGIAADRKVGTRAARSAGVGQLILEIGQSLIVLGQFFVVFQVMYWAFTVVLARKADK